MGPDQLHQPSEEACPRGQEDSAVMPVAPSSVRSLTKSDLTVVYQPIVDVKTGRTVAYEALARCLRPEFKNPAVLFQRASEQSYCGPLGRMLREIAVSQCPGVPLFVNIHPDELMHPLLVRADEPLFFHDADVFLEVTESVPLSHFEICMTVLNEMRTRGGIHLVVDDLGAGFSNLKRICDLDPRVVKLDRELVAGVDHSRRLQILMKNMVRLCNDLGARVVAEGVETMEELDASRDAGVHLAQGFYLARPSFPLPIVDPERVSLRPDSINPDTSPGRAPRSRPPNSSRKGPKKTR
jgi:EAL domain-containing protein (putative c-di-GMP-specific phosphodiesterase class I)